VNSVVFTPFVAPQRLYTVRTLPQFSKLALEFKSSGSVYRSCLLCDYHAALQHAGASYLSARCPAYP
jgi:hypothetical protein